MKTFILLSFLGFLFSCASNTAHDKGREIASVKPEPKAMRTISQIEDPESLPEEFYQRDPLED